MPKQPVSAPDDAEQVLDEEMSDDGEGVREPELAESTTPIQETAPRPSEPQLDTLPDAIDLPDLQDTVFLNGVKFGEGRMLQMALLAPDTTNAPRFALEEPENGVWQLLAGEGVSQERLHVATFKMDTGTLVFSWERQMSELSNVGQLRNCVLCLTSDEQTKTIALRTTNHRPELTIDLSKSSEQVSIGDDSLPSLNDLVLEIEEPSDLAGHQVQITPAERHVSGRDKIEFVLLERDDPPLRVVWAMQMATTRGGRTISLSTEMFSGSLSAPFTQKRVETMATALPKTVQQLKANLAQTEAQIRSCRQRQSSISERSMPPAAKQAALQAVQSEMESLAGQRNSIGRQLELNLRRLKVLPELTQLVSAIQKGVRVNGRVYYRIQDHEVKVLRFGPP